MFASYPDDNNYTYNSLFLCDQGDSYFSSSRIGILLNENGYSPNDCGSFGHNKILSTKKAYSESIERRSLAGGLSQNNFVQTIELFSGTKKEINKKNFYFSSDGCIDTTATAVNIDGRDAVISSILELIEKNATMLFWYNNDGYRLDSELIERKISKIISPKYTYEIFMTDSFSPVLVAYVFLYIEGKPIIAGTGSGVSIIYAIEKAANEALFLAKIKEEDNVLLKYNDIPKDNYTSLKEKSLNDVRTFNKLYSYPKKEVTTLNNTNRTSIDNLKKSLSCFTNNLYIHSLKVAYKKLICIKSFSPDLINYVPFKENLKFNRRIYSRISTDVLKNCFPDNPIM